MDGPGNCPIPYHAEEKELELGRLGGQMFAASICTDLKNPDEINTKQELRTSRNYAPFAFTDHSTAC